MCTLSHTEEQIRTRLNEEQAICVTVPTRKLGAFCNANGIVARFLAMEKTPTISYKMPRYFFSLESSSATILDEEGEELRDDSAAHEAALQTALELGNWDRMNHATVVVKAEDGRVVTEVPLKPLLN